MEHNIISSCGEAINVKHGGEIFARNNSMLQCAKGFVAGGMLRGYFKDNHMVCDQKICANDVPPSFVVDQNCENTPITFSLSNLYRVEKPFCRKVDKRNPTTPRADQLQTAVSGSESAAQIVRRYSRSRSPPPRDYRSPVTSSARSFGGQSSAQRNNPGGNQTGAGKSNKWKR